MDGGTGRTPGLSPVPATAFCVGFARFPSTRTRRSLRSRYRMTGARVRHVVCRLHQIVSGRQRRGWRIRSHASRGSRVSRRRDLAAFEAYLSRRGVTDRAMVVGKQVWIAYEAGRPQGARPLVDRHRRPLRRRSSEALLGAPLLVVALAFRSSFADRSWTPRAAFGGATPGTSRHSRR